MVECVWFVRPRQAKVRRQAWADAPGVAGIKTIEIEDAVRAKVSNRLANGNSCTDHLRGHSGASRREAFHWQEYDVRWIIGIILSSVLSRAITGNCDISVIKSEKEPRVVDVAVRDGVQTIRIELD